MANFCPIDMPVHVCAYVRMRYGRLELVREHCRTTPNA